MSRQTWILAIVFLIGPLLVLVSLTRGLPARRPAEAASHVVVTVTPTPYRPVAGSIRLEVDDPCCYSSDAGVDVEAYFEADSSCGDVVEMRTVIRLMDPYCYSEELIEWDPWGPFTAHKTLHVQAAGGPPVLTYDVHAQYQDAEGNLSRSYCDWVVLARDGYVLVPRVYLPLIRRQPKVR